MAILSNKPVEFVEITVDNSDQRIDNFLLTYLKGVPRSLVYRIVRSGEVRVNKGRIKPHYRLQVGDTVRIPPLKLITAQQSQQPPKKIQSIIEESIIFENEQLLVVNKPSGLAVHGGSGLSFGLIESLRASRPKTDFLELVHRLDRDTSGCLLIAKKRSSLQALHQAFRENTIEKHYRALVQGKWPRKTQRIDAPLKKNTLSSGERLVRVNKNGKSALTYITPITPHVLASLVDIKLETGRTHQIRVHTAYVEHPIAGDTKYGNSDFNQSMKQLDLRRLFLHAYSLTFCMPDSTQSGTESFTDCDNKVEIIAPLDKSLLRVLENLKKS